MFFYIPTISTSKRYENFAASIGSTNETFNQSYSNDFDSSEASTFLGCFKLPVPPAVRRPQTNTLAESCRQARKPSEGFFGLKHSFKCRRLKPGIDFFQKMSEEWKSRAQKLADFCWGTCLKISREVPEALPSVRSSPTCPRRPGKSSGRGCAGSQCEESYP